MINDLLKKAYENNASDIHITVGVPIIFRINGKLERVGDKKLMPEDTKELLFSLLSEFQKQILIKNGEIDFSFGVNGVGRFRINIYMQRGSYSAAIRPIPVSVPTIDELGLPEVLKTLAKRNKGLILVTGPTGSGKSTTLAAMIDYINNERYSHILTLEDPIEYLHRHNKSIVNQREIGNDTNSYATALKAALREDPDIILIGELRDLETISTAVTAAETGHLVLATLHTTGAVSTINRVIDVFSPDNQQQIRTQLSETLQGVVSQHLLEKKDKTGRVPAFEIIVCNQAIRNLIRENKCHQIKSSIQTGRNLGMVSMDAYVKDLYNKGIIDDEERKRHLILG